jgi:hypothetical protein
MAFTRVSAGEYRGDSRIGSIDAPYTALVAALGEPHKSTEPNYPDDDYKTDVCWGVCSTENPRAMLAIWNYKNGPAYNGGRGNIEDIDYFSVWHNDPALFQEVKNAIENAKEGIEP